ncbi:MAG TPA: FoF1 ATP synthase subunit gamma [Candidatus Omnitrophota bacterium]|nr:FoF1 ATP synthase subunit gamma [Candidatus Omnitrophota bacterium]HPT07946.1 FoF1 ATP synthase subunit gamma [Candidatus Omnitrophota bacterium]
MKTITALKNDLDFYRGLSSLIEALKNIAVSQYRALEHKIKSYEAFMKTVEEYFDFIDFSQATHPFLVASNKPQAIIVVTSDSGLLGGLNMQVVNAAVTDLEKHPGELIVVGDRGKAYALESKVPFVAFPGIRDEDRQEQAFQLRDYVFNRVLSGEFGSLKVVYPHPVSFTVQRVEKISFLPFVPPARKDQEETHVDSREIILESSLSDIVEYLAYLWMGQKLYEIFGLSRLAEFAARYVHLEGSLQRLKETDGKLKLQYFRVRHEIIDRNMRELFSARLLFAQ